MNRNEMSRQSGKNYFSSRRYMSTCLWLIMMLLKGKKWYDYLDSCFWKEKQQREHILSFITIRIQNYIFGRWKKICWESLVGRPNDVLMKPTRRETIRIRQTIASFDCSNILRLESHKKMNGADCGVLEQVVDWIFRWPAKKYVFAVLEIYLV